jgi:hypothetical protein
MILPIFNLLNDYNPTLTIREYGVCHRFWVIFIA